MKNVIYNKQYKQKIPYSFVFLTLPGMFALWLSYVFADNIINFVTLTFILSYPAYRLTNLYRADIYRIPIFKFVIRFLKYVVRIVNTDSRS